MNKAQRLLEYINNPSKQTITIEYANDGSRKALNTLLATISRLGGWGSSREVRHWVDGDGSYRATVKGLDKVDIPDTEGDPVKVPGF